TGVLIHVGRLPGLLDDLGHLGRLLLELAIQLVAHVDHARGRALELVVAAQALGDGGFVNRLWVFSLARLEPAAELAADQTENSCKEHSTASGKSTYRDQTDCAEYDEPKHHDGSTSCLLLSSIAIA